MSVLDVYRGLSRDLSVVYEKRVVSHVLCVFCYFLSIVTDQIGVSGQELLYASDFLGISFNQVGILHDIPGNIVERLGVGAHSRRQALDAAR